MQQRRIGYKKGFTLVEVLVAVGIISLLSGVVYMSFEGAREKSRDARRIADIGQLQVVLRLYIEEYGKDIDCATGVKIDGETSVETLPSSGSCPDGAQILTFVETFMGGVPHDPKGPGDDDYYYYYDPAHNCAATGQQPLLYAVNMETNESNAAEVCEVVSGNNGGYQNTTAFGGSINPSQPYVKLVADVVDD